MTPSSSTASPPRPNARRTNASNSSTNKDGFCFSDALEGRAKVFDDVVPVFESDREADAARLHPAPPLHLFGQRRVRHRVRLLNECAQLPEADGERDGVGVVGDVV